MSEEKYYTSDMNYNNPDFEAGSVFTEAQWVAKGGKAGSLALHVAKGYITEWEGQQPPAEPAEPVQLDAPPDTETVNAEDEQEPPAEEPPAEEPPAEEPPAEEPPAEEPPAEEPKPKPEGIWNFVREDLEPLPLESLNALYKDTAEKNGITNVRAYTNKESLLNKLCSQAAKTED
jgi:hypothetical protein